MAKFGARARPRIPPSSVFSAILFSLVLVLVTKARLFDFEAKHPFIVFSKVKQIKIRKI
jgi:hypothetical protein